MTEPSGPDRRRHRRFAITERGLVLSGDAQRVEADLVDVSQMGLRFRSPFQFDVGSTVTISCTWGGSKKAKVVWARDGMYGCEFEHVLRHQEVESAFSPALMVRMEREAGKLQPALMGALGVGLVVLIASRLLLH